ncbi:MAG: GTP-binding protein [Elusimicrobia bacterium]|nr:MAG: GTP-binding protein [Elusimicrobiota bacterium]
MKFIDRVHIEVRGGNGGNGCLSFLHEKYREFGGPDGGDGGRGGDVVLVADANLSTLLDVSYRPHIEARHGGNGRSSTKTGFTSDEFVMKVPVGTVVLKDGVVVADLSRAGQRFVAARGGRGGRGNASFKHHDNTAPRLYERGQPGEVHELDLELKLIADVGLAGFPNAGKSTLLTRVSNARPKVAAYPFTTLSPHLGIVSHKGRDFVMADVPGLIEGASEGKGLGDDFLRHVERTRVLVHLVDPAGFKGTGPVEGVKVIEAELKAYSRLLGDKPRLLVVSKSDQPEAAEVARRLRARYRSRKVFLMSGATGEGVSELLDAVLAELAHAPREALLFAKEGENRLKVQKGFAIVPAGEGVYRVYGAFVERAAAMTDVSLPEPLGRLQKVFKRIGLDKALRQAGIVEGDMVAIGPIELAWHAKAEERPREGRKRKPRRVFPRAA